MKYGIVGTGWIAEAFIDAARKKCGSDIAAVYSRNENTGNAFAAENGIGRVYTDFDEFCKADIDCAYIASPNSFHYSQSKLLLLSGKHVICEKPVTVTPDEYRECLEIADTNNLIYLEAIMYMHTPVRDKLREAVTKIGNITSVHLDFSQLSSKYPAFLRGEIPNIFNPAFCTGCLMDLGIYCIYPVIDMFGISGKMQSEAVFLSSGADSGGACVMNYGSFLAVLSYSKTGQTYSPSTIIGDRGTIEIYSVSQLCGVRLITADKETEIISGDIPRYETMGYEAYDFECFINGINTAKYKLCREMSFKVSEIMQQIRQQSNIKFGG